MFSNKYCLLSLVLIIFLFQNSIGQNQHDFKNYQPLKSSGEVPAEFVVSVKEKYKKDLQEHSSDELTSKQNKKIKENFLLGSNHSLERLLLSGRILYGDPITQYINKVAAEVFKNEPELLNKLRFYSFKSSSVNAACTNQGLIYINLGLIAYLQSEAELAFVLSHEAAHYQKKHSLNAAIENYEVLKGTGNHSRKSFDEKLDHLFRCSKDDEFEADSIGVERFLSTSYNTKWVSELFNMLHYCYLAYDEVPFKKDFFNVSEFVIPEVFFKDSVSTISQIENYDDTYLTHPHIEKRIAKASFIVEKKPSNGMSDFIVSEKEFLFARELARFEIIRLDLARRNYGDVIYNAYLLNDKYPNNEYLETSIAKALYGLSKYKNADEYHNAAKSYQRSEGQSQQVHYLLRQFDKKQLNTLALKYVRTMKKKYPQNQVLQNMEKDLVEEMVVKNEMKFEDFYTKIPEPKKLTVQNNQQKVNPAILQKQFQNFYRGAFVNDPDIEGLRQEFKNNYSKLEEKKKEETLSYNEREKIKAQDLKKIKKEGHKLFVKKMIVLDANVSFYSKDKVFPMLAEQMKEELQTIIIQEADKSSLPISYINWKTLEKNNESIYNDLSSFKEWMQDRYNHGGLYLVNVFNDQLESVIERYKTHHACHISVYFDKSKNMHYYEFIVYNLLSGKKEYSKFIIGKGQPKASKLKNHLKNDFKLIQN
ncbi:MAG: M48 family metallopeptidase [Bacteroidota bacterium]|nr:M48 family metallopeptidase [Bacteroidota bacterium]